MRYYDDRGGQTKRIILIVVAVVLVVAIAVLVYLNLDRLRNFVENGDLTPDSTSEASTAEPTAPTATQEPLPSIDEEGVTIGTRFNVPAGFERVPVEQGSFAEYLRSYALKPYGTVPKLHNGTDNADAPTEGVLDLAVFKGDLQQCADSIMRLYAEYKFARGEYDDISFDFNNTPPFHCDFATWITGQRPLVEGNRVSWYTPGTDDIEIGPTDDNLKYYLQKVMNFANTSSLRNQTKKVDPSDLQIGDMFIVTSQQTGTTDGHAVLVVDMAVNPATGEKIFICAEGNTPATEMYVLTNPNNGGSVWFSLDADGCFTKNEHAYPRDCIRRF